jgi:hypothetical protein
VTVRITHDGSSLDPVPLNRECPQLLCQAAAGSPKMFRKFCWIKVRDYPSARRTTGVTCWEVRDCRHGPKVVGVGRRAAPARSSRCCRAATTGTSLFLQVKNATRSVLRAPTPRPAPAGAAEEPIPTSLVNGCSGPADDAVLQLYPPRVDEPTSTGRPEGHLHWWSACSPQWPRSITPAGAGGP